MSKVLSLSSKKRFTSNKKLSLDQEEHFQESDQYLSYCTRTIPTTYLTVHIDEEFKSAKYYRYVVEAISNLDEGDEVSFILSTPGGRADGLTSLLSALKRTPAYSVSVIVGDCHSAGSFLALSCDAIAVSPHSSMLVHFISHGAYGAASHVKKEVEHTQKISEKLFRDTYKYFLTDEEINGCINQDLQLWFDADQILERLKIRQELQKQEAEDNLDDEDLEVCCNCECGEDLD
jgi:ATP-dependent protease ClpP protease subunit